MALLCRPSWPRTHRPLPASLPIAGIKKLLSPVVLFSSLLLFLPPSLLLPAYLLFTPFSPLFFKTWPVWGFRTKKPYKKKLIATKSSGKQEKKSKEITEFVLDVCTREYSEEIPEMAAPWLRGRICVVDKKEKRNYLEVFGRIQSREKADLKK